MAPGKSHTSIRTDQQEPPRWTALESQGEKVALMTKRQVVLQHGTEV